MKTQKKPTEICNTHCQWFWPKEDKSSCQTVCSSAGYLLEETKIEDPESFRITPTERKILKLLAMGKSRKVIKETLNMSDDTLQHHFENMRRKAKYLEDEPDDAPIIDEKEIIGIPGMHIVNRPAKVESNEFYEVIGRGKPKRIDEDM